MAHSKSCVDIPKVLVMARYKAASTDILNLFADSPYCFCLYAAIRSVKHG